MAWTETRIKTLKRLWNEGVSASQIAKEMGDVTRNAVIGKVHRLGLSMRGGPSSPSSRKPVRKRADSRTKTRPIEVRPRGQKHATASHKNAANGKIPSPVERRIGVLSLTEKTCKWPIGDPNTDEFYFCGADAQIDSPYCPTHAKQAYQPLERKRSLAQKNKRVSSIR